MYATRWKGRRRSAPSHQRPIAQKRAGTAGDYSIAPTEFPKDAVRGKVSLGLSAARTRCIRPSGGEDLRLVTPKRRIPNVAIPENLMEKLAKPVIHRLQMVPADRKRQQDFGSFSQAQAQRKALLEYRR